MTISSSSLNLLVYMGGFGGLSDFMTLLTQAWKIQSLSSTYGLEFVKVTDLINASYSHLSGYLLASLSLLSFPEFLKPRT